MSARADIKRLNWIMHTRATVEYDGACCPPWSVYFDQVDHHLRGLPRLAGEGGTLREAIDNAMRATAQDGAA